MLGALAASALGLVAYHKSVRGRAERHFRLYNHGAALIATLPNMLKGEDEKFPQLDVDEAERYFQGVQGEMSWQAQLLRMQVTGLPFFFRFRVVVTIDGDRAEFVNYLLPSKAKEVKK